MSDREFPVRIGLVGFGDFGQCYAATITNLAEATLMAIVDVDENRLHDARSRFPVARSVPDIDAAVAQTDVDAWIVASGTSSHVSVARQCLAAGKSVLVEKPIASSSDEAFVLKSLVDRDANKLMMGHVVLFNTEFAQLLKECKSRKSIRFVDAVRHRPVTTIDKYPGEDPFGLTMVHDLYCVVALKQRAEPNRFAAQIRRRRDGRCDLAVAQLGFEDGCLVKLTASFLTPEGMPEDGFDRTEVFGEDWAARAMANPRPFQLWDSRSRHPMTLELGCDQQSGMLAEQLRCFCRVVRGEQAVPVGASFEDAIQVQRWIERLTSVAIEIR
jgi:UDP-N-acetylglucosamine 3-dehydrogenase